MIRYSIHTAGALALVLVLMALWRGDLQQQRRASELIRTEGGLDSLERLWVGGTEQWVLLRGHRQNSPVLLYLHSGPGDPVLARTRAFSATGLE